MNNPIGYGVFGTFGDPHGYQQVFYHGVDFKGSLELDDNAIAFYTGTELYAIKRVLAEGVYTVCFCIYSFARGMNTERQGTYIGSCIVLQNSYAEADYIYKVLCALHESVTGGGEHFEGDTLKVAQVQDIAVREPADFVALKANVIPINKTPFFSPQVDPGKQYFVVPDPFGQDRKSVQVTTFFDEGLKYFNDTGTLYFSFDKNVSEFVSNGGYFDIIQWGSFLEYKTTKQTSTVVRPKKGIQKMPGGDLLIEVAQYDRVPADIYRQEPTEETNAAPYVPLKTRYEPYPASLENDDDDDADDDPNKPFDLWEDPVPASGWTAAEAREKMKEYNRLFKYTNSLLEYINEPSKKRRKNKAKERNNTGRAGAKETTAPPKKNKKIKMVLILLGVLIVGSAAVYFLVEDSYETEPVIPVPAIVQAPLEETTQDENDTIPIAVVQTNTTAEKQGPTKTATTLPTTEKAEPAQPVTKAPVGPQPYQPEEKVKTEAAPASAAVKKSPPDASIKIAQEDELTTSQPPISREPAQYLKAKELRPKPNMELTQYNISALNQAGVKDKTLLEIVKLLYDNVPSNIGNVYIGQETEYAAALLNSNRQVFQKSGSNYMCVADNATTLHIPAYKSPRLPVVYPK